MFELYSFLGVMSARRQSVKGGLNQLGKGTDSLECKIFGE